MKPERKPLLHMTPLENSCPPRQPIASTPGKSEIRSGSRLLISDCITRPGNSLPKDMVPLKSFRYYLPLLTNSDFPPHGKYMMYVFHTSLLSSYRSTESYGPTFSSPPPDVIDNEEEYEVETILSHKGPNSRRLYLTTWKGYPSSENTWEPEVNLRHSLILAKAYKQEHNLR